MSALLTVDDLHVRFSKGEEALVHALNGACLQVREREVVGILGESGSGKSTLARCLLRLLARNAIATGMIQFSVIDAFDTMVSSRPYRKGLPLQEAIRRLHEASGTQFDPEVIRRFFPIAPSEMPAVLEAVGVTESSAF